MRDPDMSNVKIVQIPAELTTVLVGSVSPRFFTEYSKHHIDAVVIIIMTCGLSVLFEKHDQRFGGLHPCDMQEAVRCSIPIVLHPFKRDSLWASNGSNTCMCECNISRASIAEIQTTPEKPKSR